MEAKDPCGSGSAVGRADQKVSIMMPRSEHGRGNALRRRAMDVGKVRKCSAYVKRQAIGRKADLGVFGGGS